MTKRLLFLNLEETYRNGLTPEEKEAATRGNWKINLKKAEQIDYVFGHKNHEIVTAYKPKKGSWVKMLPNKDYPNKPRQWQRNRVYFEIDKNLTPKEQTELEKSIGTDICTIFKLYRNPIRYINK